MDFNGYQNAENVAFVVFKHDRLCPNVSEFNILPQTISLSVLHNFGYSVRQQDNRPSAFLWNSQCDAHSWHPTHFLSLLQTEIILNSLTTRISDDTSVEKQLNLAFFSQDKKNVTLCFRSCVGTWYQSWSCCTLSGLKSLKHEIVLCSKKTKTATI